MKPTDTVTIEAKVNGNEVEETFPARTLLSELLRDYQNLTGTHRGCETAKCGACSVLLDGEVVKSCNILAAQAEGSEVTTVEGLAEGKTLHPVQESYWDLHGMQCGYCTPGFVMTTTALLKENDDPNVGDIREALSGNLCRCTGYTKIVESVQHAAAKMREESDE